MTPEQQKALDDSARARRRIDAIVSDIQRILAENPELHGHANDNDDRIAWEIAERIRQHVLESRAAGEVE